MMYKYHTISDASAEDDIKNVDSVAANTDISTPMASHRYGRVSLHVCYVLIYTAYFPACKYILDVFHCVQDTHTPERFFSYLNAAPYMSCKSDTYKSMLYLSIPLFLVYIIGIPLYFLYRTVKYHRKHHTHTHSQQLHFLKSGDDSDNDYISETSSMDSNASVTAASLGPSPSSLSARAHELSFLWQSVKPAYYWYPIVILTLRKFVISVFLTAFPFQSVYIPLGVLCVLVCALLVQVVHSPYRSITDNRLEAGLLSVACVVYLAGILSTSFTDTDMHSNMTSLPYVIAIMKLCVYVVIVLVLGRYYLRKLPVPVRRVLSCVWCVRVCECVFRRRGQRAQMYATQQMEEEELKHEAE